MSDKTGGTNDTLKEKKKSIHNCASKPSKTNQWVLYGKPWHAARFHAFTAVYLRSLPFWDVIECMLVFDDWCFRATCQSHGRTAWPLKVGLIGCPDNNLRHVTCHKSGDLNCILLRHCVGKMQSLMSQQLVHTVNLPLGFKELQRILISAYRGPSDVNDMTKYLHQQGSEFNLQSYMSIFSA